MTKEELEKRLSDLTEEMSKDGVPEDREMRGALSVLLALVCAVAAGSTTACATHMAEFTRDQLHVALRESQEISPARLN